MPRGIENKVAIGTHTHILRPSLTSTNSNLGMVSDRVIKTLKAKSRQHQADLKRLGVASEDAPLTANVMVLPQTSQVRGINTVLVDPDVDREDFIFYFDRLVGMLVEKATEAGVHFSPCRINTPVPGETYDGLSADDEPSAVVILRGGSCLETGLKRVIPDCRTGRLLIQSSARTGEPELHFYKLAPDIAQHGCVLLLDPQMSSGGAALMAVKVLLDHGVKEERIVFVTYLAGRRGLGRLMGCFPALRVVVGRLVDDEESRWVEQRYLGC